MCRRWRRSMDVRSKWPKASPDLARGRAEMVRAERQLELERAQRLPRSGLEGQHGQ
jgi:hypothetical protein